jgi:hypothetical protein
MKTMLMVTIFAALLAIPFAADAVTLIGHWGFEEGSGSAALDSSANHLDGTIHGATYTTGKVGSYALDFNGSSSYVEVPNNSLLNAQSIAISLWFMPRTSQVKSADILDKGHGQGNDPYYGGYAFQYEENSATIGTFYGNGSTFPFLNTGGSYKDNTWHHIVVNLGAGIMTLWVDGNLIGTAPDQGAIVANSTSLYFGRHSTLGRYFNGLIDDVQIYSGSLTADEAYSLYTTGTVVPVPATVLLLAPGLAGLAVIRRRCRR